ncbi:TrmH family RNA methyltransferase [Gorillibacterium timonense]|uniref:TrmH family RNA methyltransferase n=1 Tax=Gorillibacterium timonense TaxID=1689269 RepID=UPI00071C6FB5|nr:TrmH family RNA methyltransferase [Gorillibacterium timonense]
MKNKTNGIKPYQKEFDYSYALGAYATIELLQVRPDIVRSVLLHSKCTDRARVVDLCRINGIPIVYDDNRIARISPKENCYVIGVFSKYEDRIEEDKPHLVLVQPGDMGNVGTILRMAAGFHVGNLAIVLPAADRFHPRTVRASMGSLFRMKCETFQTFDHYRSRFGQHRLFPFMLHGETVLTPNNCPRAELFSLIFGNEATGLDEALFGKVGTSLTLPQSELVDSLNLSVAAGIGTYLFASKNGLI